MGDENDTEELLDEDGAEYSHKSEYSKAAVVQAQVMKCNELRSKEMCEGHTIRTFDKVGNLKIIDIPDSRQPFIGGVIALKGNLAPEIRREIKGNKNFKEALESFESEKKGLEKKYKYREIRLKNVGGEIKLVYTGREYLPKKGAVLTESIKKGKGIVSQEKRIEGLWDDKVNAYWDAMVFLYDDLFAEINILIDENDYFKEKSSW